MWKDSIVEEVREAGAKLAEECGYDLHAFANMLRRHQKKDNWPVASVDHLKKPESRKVASG